MEPETKLGSTPETALPVRSFSKLVGDWIARLGRVWIEGQVLTIKNYGRTSYITFRDVEAEMSVNLVATPDMLAAANPPVVVGSRVLVLGTVEWWGKNGSVNIRAHEFRAVGVGDLLAELESRRRKLAAEGLFDPDRKRPLPFLPRKVGLITGRDTDAKRDVIVNARRRWPATRFEVREIQLQTQQTPVLTANAIKELQQDPEVDVIVIARGGGSMEDLLPWSDEGLIRAVAASVKPIVSAIGHEADRPLLDEVADVRASTPTDAARRIVPDLNEERAITDRLAVQLGDRRQRWLAAESRHLQLARQTVAARSPAGQVRLRLSELAAARNRLLEAYRRQVTARRHLLVTRREKLAALSPYAVLARGYALATTADGTVVRGPADLAVGTSFQLRLADGSIAARREPDTQPTTGAAK